MRDLSSVSDNEQILTPTLTIHSNSYQFTETPEINLITHNIESPHFTEITSYTIQAPSYWNLETISEWPEQDGVGNNTGFTCTGLALKRNDGKGVLFITPVCGWAEEIPGNCPEDTVMVFEDDERSLVRHYDEDKGKYIYQTMYFMSTPDENYNNKEKPDVACVSAIQTNGDVAWAYYEARIFSEGSEKEVLLSTIDSVVISGL